jgi:hypothetical protein
MSIVSENRQEELSHPEKRFISNFSLDGRREGFLNWTTLTIMQREYARVKRMYKRLISKCPLIGRQAGFLTWTTNVQGEKARVKRKQKRFI